MRIPHSSHSFVPYWGVTATLGTMGQSSSQVEQSTTELVKSSKNRASRSGRKTEKRAPSKQSAPRLGPTFQSPQPSSPGHYDRREAPSRHINEHGARSNVINPVPHDLEDGLNIKKRKKGGDVDDADRPRKKRSSDNGKNDAQREAKKKRQQTAHDAQSDRLNGEVLVQGTGTGADLTTEVRRTLGGTGSHVEAKKPQQQAHSETLPRPVPSPVGNTKAVEGLGKSNSDRIFETAEEKQQRREAKRKRKEDRKSRKLKKRLERHERHGSQVARSGSHNEEPPQQVVRTKSNVAATALEHAKERVNDRADDKLINQSSSQPFISRLSKPVSAVNPTTEAHRATQHNRKGSDSKKANTTGQKPLNRPDSESQRKAFAANESVPARVTARAPPQDKVQGPFTQEEYKQLAEFFDEYRQEHEISEYDLNSRVQQTRSGKGNRPFWDVVAAVLPHRKRGAIQKYCRRRWHNYDKRGSWTAEEDRELREAYKKTPNKWKEIGDSIDRMPEDCRDRWRNYLCLDPSGKGEIKKRDAIWTEREETTFKEIVAEHTKKLVEQGIDAEKGKAGQARTIGGMLDWRCVGKDMAERGYLRSRLQCMTKWDRLKTQAGKELQGDQTSNADEGAPKRDWRARQAERHYKLMRPADKLDVLCAVTAHLPNILTDAGIPWQLIGKEFEARRSLWFRWDLEVAFKHILEENLKEKHRGLPLQKRLKKATKRLKKTYGKQTLSVNRYVNTAGGKLVNMKGWSSLSRTTKSISDEFIVDSDEEAE